MTTNYAQGTSADILQTFRWMENNIAKHWIDDLTQFPERNKMVFNDTLTSRISATGAIAVLIVDEADAAVPLARALLEGGINCMELTLRTDAALDALSAIKANVPEMIAGVGTILTPEQIDRSVDAGADFGVSPGLNRRVVDRAIQRGFSFAPGVATPSEIEAALELGCRIIKFFPAEPSGGLKYLESMAAPYEHLQVQYVPLGGIRASNCETYLRSPLIAAIGGSFIATRNQIQNRQWDAIRESARTSHDIVQKVRESPVATS